MANIQEFSYVPRSAANVNVPRVEIFAKVYDDNGNLLSDFTGTNSLMFPGVISTLSNEQRRELGEMIAQWLVLKKAGVNQ